MATGVLRGASHARTAGGTDSGGSAGAACPSSGGRFPGALADPPPGAGAGSVAAPDAGDVAASALTPAPATTPAGRGGVCHSRPLRSYGSRMPGGTDGRTGTAGRRPFGPGIAGEAGAVAASGAVAAVDGRPAGAGDRSPTGSAGGVAGDVSILAEGDVVLQAPPETRHPARGSRPAAAGWRRGDGDDGSDPRRHGSVPEPSSGATRAPRGARLSRPRGRGRRRLTRRHAAGAARCARDGYSRSSFNDRLEGLDMHGGKYLH